MALLGVAGGGVVGALGALSGQRTGRLTPITTLPVAALVVVIAGVALLPVSLRRPWVPIAAFLGWLPFEDLLRKFAGNDIRVYAVKELLFLLALIGLAGLRVSDVTVRKICGRAYLPLFVLVAWAAMLTVPSLLVDWRLAAIGLRFDFLYIPLVLVGYLLVRKVVIESALRRLSLLAAVVLSVGLVQTILGPSFLSPERATPGLNHLELERSLLRGPTVYRPTGTFVEPSRYAAMALIGLALGLAWINMGGPKLPRRRRGLISASVLVVAAGSVWAAGARATILGGVVLAASALVGPLRARRRRAVGRIATAALGMAIALIAFAGLFPVQFSNRVSFYSATLDPRSDSNEWAFRLGNYSTDAARGVKLGGLIGRGTGSQSVGLQYLYGGDSRSLAGIYQIESGYGSVAYEWGAIGLGLWLWWSIAWSRQLMRSVRRRRGTNDYVVMWVLNAWIFFFLFVTFFGGLAYFQNYLANAYFWLFSGIVFGLGKGGRDPATAAFDGAERVLAVAPA